MLATSEEIQAAWLSTSRQLSIRLKMNDITYGSEEITSLSFNSGSISGEVFQIGSTPLNSVQVVFPTIIETVKEDLEIEPELGILINGEYQFTKLGHFFITDFERDRNSNKTTITANDKMIYMEGIYDSKLTYPKSYREVALEIANLAGVEIDQASFASLGTEWVQKPVGYTFRQAIGLIAQFEGGFASFNRKGELTIKRLTPTDFEITPESYMLKGFTKNENSYRIGGITVKTGEEETDVIRVGSTNGSQVELENKVMTQTHLNQMWELVKTLNYFPYELKWRGSPILEAGDWIYIVDKDGTRYSVPNLSYNITFNGGMTAESKANTNSSSQATYRYRGPLNQRVDYVESLLSANKWNSNYYDQTEPIDPKEGDIWFKPNGVDTEIWVYEKNSSGELDWVFKVSTATDPDLVKEIEQAKQAGKNAQEAADQAKADAQSAQAKADKIQIDVNGIVSDVTTINGTVNSISSKANEAYNKANAVESRTVTLETSVTGLTGRITDVESTATSTTKKLNELVVTVDGQKQTIATVTSTANSALSKANVLESTVDGVKQTLTSVEEWQNDFYIGARNWVSESEAPKFRAYQSAVITYTTVSVPEWNATNAVRHVVTGGTGTICGTLPGNIITYVKDNTDYVHSMYVKNNGDKRVTFNNNLSQSVVVEPGETKRIVMKAHHNVNLAAMQFVLYRPVNTDSLDFTVWRAQIEEGVALSDWSPAPEDKAQTTKVNQIESTVEGTIQTVASVKNTADSALTKATQVETTANGLKTTISSVETTANSALTKATQVEATANGLTSTVSEMNTTAVNTDWKGRVAGALQLSADPTFLKGSNNLIPYNNTAGGSVVLTRQNIPLSSGGTQPTGSAYRMMIETKGPSSPALGGFYYRLDARVNAKFIIRFIANIPFGRTVYHAHNQVGDGSSVRWLTPRQGTGTWSEYAYLVQCGTGGTFSTFGFQYIQSVAGDNPTPEAPFRWYVAKFEVFDITNSNQSQITQLSDTINLKVSKDDVVNQINISTDGVLIAGNKVQITGQTYIEDGVIGRAQIANLAVSTAQIADAAITDAKIGSLSATKITTGTLNAANVNIINLNANSIVSGTLNAIDLTGGKITQSDSGEYSMELLKGSIYFRRSTNELARIQPIYVSKEPVGLAIVQMPGEIFSINTGSATDTTSMPIFQIPDTSSRTNMEWKMYGLGNVDAIVNFNNTVNAKLRLISTNTVEAKRIVTGNKDSYVMQMDGDKYLSVEGEYGVRIKHNQSGSLYTPIEAKYNQIKLDVYSGANITLKTDRLEINNGGDSYFSDAPAGVTLGISGGKPRIWSVAIYNYTGSGSANLVINSNGTIFRSTSARKYKANIRVANKVIADAKKILKINPVSWIDKFELSSGDVKGRYYGFIADEFHEKGMTEVVNYGESGQVEGLAYDRLTMYQNVILSDHEREIKSLKNEVDQLKNKLKELEAA